MQDDNPYWHDANHVLVPYCSSDSWSGTKIHPEARDGWSFMGSLIVRQVIADLIPLGLGRSQGGELLMAGSSAGGLGVMLNLDKVKRFLRAERGIKITVRGVSDSGWFLDREPYAPDAVSTVDVVKQGWKLWGGALPDACVAKHATEPWRCYFGHRLYPTLKCKFFFFYFDHWTLKSNEIIDLDIFFICVSVAPLFVFQWLFDEAQMRADSVGAPVTPQQWDYIHEMGAALRTSLDNVTAVFAPSCIGHAVLTKRDWLNIKIDDISLVDALRCWERSTRKHKGKGKGLARRNSDGSQINRRERIQLTNSDGLNGNESSTATTAMVLHRQRHRLTKEERIRRRQNMTEEERERRRLNRIRKSQQQNGRNVNQNGGDGRRRNAQQKNSNRMQEQPKANNAKQLGGSGGGEASTNGKPNQNKNRKRRRNRNNENGGRNVSHRKKFTEPKRCSLRLLERCSWPQCNHSCPALTNPLTGEEMRFLELLSSFGLDIEAVATALGIDMQTLNNMDHAELVNLLTQQVS